MKVEKTRIYGLDLMRALAIIMVITAHALYIFPDSNNAFFDLMRIVGMDGVELFFVLSGFLIGGILLRLLQTTDFSIKTLLYFWIRRWFRTLPLYYLMLLVNLIVALIIGYDLPHNLWRYVFFLQNFSEYHIPFFPESWSLSVEEYAYLSMPITLFFISKVIKSRNRVFLVSSIFLVLVFFLTKVYYQFNLSNKFQTMLLWNSHLKAIVIYRLDAIFYGFIIAYYFYNFNDRIQKIRGILFLLGFILSFIALIILPMFGVLIENYPFYWNVLYLPLNSIGIALMLPYFYYLKRPSSKTVNIIEKISRYSYAMYLLHYTFILYLIQILIGFAKLNTVGRLVTMTGYLVLVYIISKMVYAYFEKPTTDLRDSAHVKRFFKI